LNINTNILEHLSLLTQSAIYLLHIPSKSYRYLSNSVVLKGRLDTKLLKEGGFDLVRDTTHPLDFDGTVLFEQIIKETLMGLAPELRYSLTTAYDYTLFVSEREQMRVLQRNSFLDFDSKGKPVLKLGIIYNISHLKQYDSQLCKISYAGNNHLYYSHSRNIVAINPETAPNHIDLGILNKLAYGNSPETTQRHLGISEAEYSQSISRMNELLCPKNKEAIVSLAQLYSLTGSPTGEILDINQLITSLAFAQ